MIADEELIKEIKQGSKPAMKLLVKRYYKIVYAYIYRNIFDKSIAYDLTQETFIKIIKNLKNYAEKGSLKSWMLTIASNQCRDYFRSKEAKSNLLNVSLEENRLESNESTVSSVFEKNERRKNIIHKMKQLPFEQREVIILKFFHEFKLKEIVERSDFYDEQERGEN